MASAAFSYESFMNVPIVGILRNISMEDVGRILPLYEQAGLTTVEITMNTPHAEEIIHCTVARHAGRLNVGAGTVCDVDELERALNAGAQFIVTPVLDEQVVIACVQRRIPVFPGAYTPSEILKAWTIGASMVKIFPATSLGHSYIKDLKGPLPQIKLMPVGGIDLDNCADFMAAGADALGIGGKLFDKKLIEGRNWESLQAHFEMYVEKINKRIV